MVMIRDDSLVGARAQDAAPAPMDMMRLEVYASAIHVWKARSSCMPNEWRPTVYGGPSVQSGYESECRLARQSTHLALMLPYRSEALLVVPSGHMR